MSALEFSVPGPPISAQSKNKPLLATWRAAVEAEAKKAAAAAGLAAPMTGSMRFVCVNYHEGNAPSLDDDNMVKPIRDVLQGIVYANDKQISDSSVRQTSIDGVAQFRRASPVVALAFSKGDEFVYIKVEPAPSHTKLLT